MGEVERIAKEVNNRSIIQIYFIAISLRDGDLQCANELHSEELFNYNQGSGGAGIILTKLQALGLINDLGQESLNTLNEEEIEKAIQNIEPLLPDKRFISKLNNK